MMDPHFKLCESDPHPEPLHCQISRRLRARILTGELPAGARLPSIRAQARDCQVSVITVRHAYEVLEGEGLIRALPAKGFFVAALSRRRMCRRAEERFAEALRPVLAAGREEGMSRQRLEEIFQRILDGLEPREREEVGGAS